MRKKYLLFILSFLSLSISTFAQHRVKITIREAGTQQPLLGAHITIAPHKEHQDTLIAITDKDGKAFINLEKENASYFYKVNMMGYMPVSGTLLATEKEVNVVLKEACSVRAFTIFG